MDNVQIIKKTARPVRRVSRLAGSMPVQVDYLPVSWGLVFAINFFMCAVGLALVGVSYLLLSPQVSAAMSALPTLTPTFTVTPSPMPTWTPQPTFTPLASLTPIPTWTPLPTWTPIATWTPQPTFTPSPTITPTDTVTPIPTPTRANYTYEQLKEKPDLATALGLSSEYDFAFYRAICFDQATDKFIQPRIVSSVNLHDYRWRLSNHLSGYDYQDFYEYSDDTTFYLSDNASIFSVTLFLGDKQVSQEAYIAYPVACKAAQFIFVEPNPRPVAAGVVGATVTPTLNGAFDVVGQ
jgi:hypothetical protein